MQRSAHPFLLSASLALALSAAAVAASAAPTATGAPGVSELAAGARLLEAARPAEALPELQRAAAREGPLRDLAWLLLGRAALEAGEHERALAAAALAPDAVPASVRRADAAWLRARVLEALGRSAEAARAWASFAVEHSGDARAGRARVNEAAALEAAGSTAAAARAFRRLGLESPATAPPDALERASRLAAAAGIRLPAPTGSELLARADALASANRHARAVEAYREAESVLGGGADTDKALVRRARSLYLLRRNEESAAACVELARRFPSSSLQTAALHRRARVAWRGDEGETLLALTKEARDAPRHRSSSWRDDLLHVRAGYFLEKKRWDEAVAAFEEVIAQYPDSSLADDSRWKAAWARLRQGRPGEAAERFEELLRVGRSEELVRAASYWAGVVRGRLGEREASQALLESTHRRWPFRYHGVEARALLAGYLGREQLAALDAEVEASGTAFEHPGRVASADPRFHRYELLRSLELHDHALDELEDLRRHSTDTDALVFELARARSRSGAAAAGFNLLSRRFWKPLEQPSRRSAPEFWEIAYPRPWGRELERWCAQRGVDPALAAGLVRSESWWSPAVRSSADARGLMQMLPSTGRRVAAQESLADFDPEQLFDPDLNLRLGTRYLGDLLTRFDGDAAAAAASYNAGEDKVERWWADFETEGVHFAPERVARIPYRETRRYVRRVLEAAAWYRWLAQAGAEPPEAG